MEKKIFRHSSGENIWVTICVFDIRAMKIFDGKFNFFGNWEMEIFDGIFDFSTLECCRIWWKVWSFRHSQDLIFDIQYFIGNLIFSTFEKWKYLMKIKFFRHSNDKNISWKIWVFLNTRENKIFDGIHNRTIEANSSNKNIKFYILNNRHSGDGNIWWNICCFRHSGDIWYFGFWIFKIFDEKFDFLALKWWKYSIKIGFFRHSRDEKFDVFETRTLRIFSEKDLIFWILNFENIWWEIWFF